MTKAENGMAKECFAVTVYKTQKEELYNMSGKLHNFPLGEG